MQGEEGYAGAMGFQDRQALTGGRWRPWWKGRHTCDVDSGTTVERRQVDLRLVESRDRASVRDEGAVLLSRHADADPRLEVALDPNDRSGFLQHAAGGFRLGSSNRRRQVSTDLGIEWDRELDRPLGHGLAEEGAERVCSQHCVEHHVQLLGPQELQQVAQLNGGVEGRPTSHHLDLTVREGVLVRGALRQLPLTGPEVVKLPTYASECRRTYPTPHGHGLDASKNVAEGVAQHGDPLAPPFGAAAAPSPPGGSPGLPETTVGVELYVCSRSRFGT